MRYPACSSAQPRGHRLQGRRGRQVEHHRAHLRPQEVVRAGRPERGQARMLRPGEEVEHDLVVVEVPDLRAVGRGEAAHDRQQRRRPFAPLRLRQRSVAVDRRAERVGPAVLRDEPLGGPDDVQRVRLARLGRLAPRGDPVAAEDAADGFRMVPADRRDVEAELEAGPPPADPGHPVPERLAGEGLAVRRRRQRDPGVRVEMVDVGRVDEAVHRGVDRRRRAAPPVEAVVERRDHLVLALDARIHVHQRAEPVEPEHRQPGVGERAQVPARALDPQQLDGRPRHRVDRRPLGRRVAARVVRVPRVRPEPVRPVEERLARGRGFDAHAPHPAAWPPTRSATIRSAYPERA